MTFSTHPFAATLPVLLGWLLLGTPLQAQSYSVAYEYDAQGRLVVATYEGPALAEPVPVTYTFDAGGALTGSTTGPGQSTATGAGADLPVRFAIHPAYPNPFNPSTRISYDLPRAARVTLAIYDVLGRQVARLVDGEQAAGYHSTQWDGRTTAGSPVTSGVYLYHFSAGDFVKTRTMLLVK